METSRDDPPSRGPDVTGSLALVTGAGGIGRAVALALAEAGADVAALDLDEPLDTVPAGGNPQAPGSGLAAARTRGPCGMMDGDPGAA